MQSYGLLLVLQIIVAGVTAFVAFIEIILSSMSFVICFNALGLEKCVSSKVRLLGFVNSKILQVNISFFVSRGAKVYLHNQLICVTMPANYAADTATNFYWTSQFGKLTFVINIFVQHGHYQFRKYRSVKSCTN